MRLINLHLDYITYASKVTLPTYEIIKLSRDTKRCSVSRSAVATVQCCLNFAELNLVLDVGDESSGILFSVHFGLQKNNRVLLLYFYFSVIFEYRFVVNVIFVVIKPAKEIRKCKSILRGK